MRVARIRLLMLCLTALVCYERAAADDLPDASHWAYESARRPSLPDAVSSTWPENPVDAFVQAAMATHGLTPSPEADLRTLIRRVTLDITGLPPTIDEIDALLADTAPGAYERLVDRLLQSPRFGERMATHWLDLARYADTHGYHMDAHRDMWRWRDWVITAYNQNMPFDQFTIEQLAGDLLPDATLSQQIATGFNRNNMVNFENGAIADEYLAEYAIDRVTTTATVWLGQTMVCARCHDHKYDPFTQRDFYRLFAFFNQVPEQGIDGNKGNAAPFIEAPLPEQLRRQKQLSARRASMAVAQERRVAAADEAVRAWEAGFQDRQTRRLSSTPRLTVRFDRDTPDLDDAIRGAKTFVPGKLGDALLFDGRTSAELANQAAVSDGDSLTIALWLFPTTSNSAIVLQRGKRNAADFGYRIELDEGRVQCHVSAPENSASVGVATGEVLERFKWQHLAVRYRSTAVPADIAVFLNGRHTITSSTGEIPTADLTTASSLVIGGGTADESFRGMLDDLRIFAAALTDDEIAMLAGGDPIGDILAVPRDDRTPEQAMQLKSYYLERIDSEYQQTMRDIEATERALAELQASVPTAMVMQDVHELRTTRILTNGRYDSPGELVSPGIPAIFPPLPDGVEPNRLALARWLVSPQNPLTARVAVNHLWQQFFGNGLVRTPEDFGTRGELPTHPELLDWLATEFAQDWDVKRLVRLLVTSATYRQSHRLTPELAERDPENRWLARASRLRLSAEMVRDNALAASGLLVERTGGPSVFPYQPDGLWEAIAYNANDFTAQVYRQSHGADLYRRSLYTFVKRSLPAPTLAAFDAPNRETCVARRLRTNTPQQALVLMNDVTFIEAARALAERTLARCQTAEDRIDHMLLACTGRPATAGDQRIILALVADLHQQYLEHPQLADDLLTSGEKPVASDLAPHELAVWAAAANVLLSLDEVITRP